MSGNKRATDLRKRIGALLDKGRYVRVEFGGEAHRIVLAQVSQGSVRAKTINGVWKTLPDDTVVVDAGS